MGGWGVNISQEGGGREVWVGGWGNRQAGWKKLSPGGSGGGWLSCRPHYRQVEVLIELKVEIYQCGYFNCVVMDP